MQVKNKATPSIEADTHANKDLLSHVIESSPSFSAKQTLDGLFIGVIDKYNDNGLPMISVIGLLNEPIPAQSICQLTPENIGNQCAIMFTTGNIQQPVIMGLLQQTVIAFNHPEDDAIDIEETAETIQINADKNLHFQCGKASIQMSADGRIELHGSTIVNHATGLNRIRGASVKLN